MSLSKRARRAARKRAKYVKVHLGGWTTATRAIEKMKAGRAYLNEEGELELILRVSGPADPLEGRNFAWFSGESPRHGVKVRKATIAKHASFR